MTNLRFPRLAYNLTSSVGATLAAISGLLVIIMLIISIFTHIENPYLGIFSFIILPAVLILGLILIPVGMYRQWRKEKRGEESQMPRWPYLDLNIKSHRNAFFIFAIGTFFFVIFTAVGSYQAFHFSESVQFCGTTCHRVMEPEYTAYRNSPHARVACVECHVGSGAGWYTRSKLSGAYQVYATLTNRYPRPIPTPIQNLRPARETCEECHWPEKFIGAQQKTFAHFLYDERNSPWPINMLLKVGGSQRGTGKASGIHWHVSDSVKIEYIPGERQRQSIPWVRFTDLKTGKITIYQDENNPSGETDRLSAMRLMDCVDCHNRPSHIYHSPDEAVDDGLQIGLISTDIPEIKAAAVSVMAIEYASPAEAMVGIRDSLITFYKNKHEKYYAANNAGIEQAISAVQYEYSQNIFPVMKVRWSAYPDNIGHFYNIGCMRCHDGFHISEEGQAISHDCNSCHLILSQGSGERAESGSTDQGLEFTHPVDISEAWREIGCYECHAGIQP